MGQRNYIDVDKEIADQPKYEITYTVSANKMKVYVRINLHDKDADVDFQDVLDLLEEQKIVYGLIKEEEIKEYCDKKHFFKELVVATGLEPVQGKDAELIYDFDIHNNITIAEKEDGTVDFQNLNNIRTVSKDDLLCHVIPATEGKDGINVYNESVPYKECKRINLNADKNTYVTEDGTELRAQTDGCIQKVRDRVYVDNVYTIQNVDNSTGNIDFPGSIVVNGDIKAGFTVKAQYDIKVKGMVEGAFVEAGNDIIISSGMNGMGKGKLISGGNVTSKYIENATIEAGQNIYADALINSEITAKESIILKGPRSCIIGGTTIACQMIYAKTIGSKTNPLTNISIDLSKYAEWQKSEANAKEERKKVTEEIEIKESELEILENNRSALMGAMNNNEAAKATYKALVFKKLKLNTEINELKKKIETDVQSEDISNHRIVCRGTIFSNTKISVGWIKYNVNTDLNYSKIYIDGSDITIAPLLPSDIQ